MKKLLTATFAAALISTGCSNSQQSDKGASSVASDQSSSTEEKADKKEKVTT